MQLLEAEDEQLTSNIRASQILIHAIRQLATDPPGTQAEGEAASTTGPRRIRERSEAPAPNSGQSDSSYDEDGMDNDGEGEISALAKRILELVEGKKDKSASGEEGAGPAQFNPSANGAEATTGSGHDDLRASVQRAFSGQQ